MEIFTCILNLLLSLSLQGLVLASSPNAGEQPQDRPEPTQSSEQATKVTVLVHNYAHLPRQVLSDAKDRASLIFRKAGVEIEWADCPTNNEEPSLYPKCPVVVDASLLFLRILPITPAKMDHGGESFVAARIANVFWNRVEEQARRLEVSVSRILAQTVAHELGHLLLGSNSHSAAGIMTPRWDSQAMTRICQDGLYFNRQQSERIQSELRRRIGQRCVTEVAGLISHR